MINKFNKGEKLKASRLNEIVYHVNNPNHGGLYNGGINRLGRNGPAPFEMMGASLDSGDNTSMRLLPNEFWVYMLGDNQDDSAAAITYNSGDGKYYALINSWYDYNGDDQYPVTYPVSGGAPTDYVMNRYTFEIHEKQSLDDAVDHWDNSQFIKVFTISGDNGKIVFENNHPFTAQVTAPFQPLVNTYITTDGAVSEDVDVIFNGGYVLDGTGTDYISGKRFPDTTFGADSQHCFYVDTTSGVISYTGVLWDSVGSKEFKHPLYDVSVQYNGDERICLFERYYGENNIIVEERPYPNLWTYIEPSGDGYQIGVTYGAVRWQNIRGDNGYLVPTLNGTSLAAEPPPTVAYSNQSLVYVHQATDSKGKPSGTPTIEMLTTSQGSEHHFPPDPDNTAGRVGDYYFNIAEIQEVGGVPTVEQRLCGNINLPNQLVENVNLSGGVAEIYQDYDEDSDQHKWRSFVERSSNPGIFIRELPNHIRIEGNGFDGTLLFTNCDDENLAKIEFTDGLGKIYNWNNSDWEEDSATVVVPPCTGTTLP